MSTATADRIRTIIVDYLGVDREKVVDSARLEDDLGADSLDVLDIAIGIDAEFDVEIPDNIVEDIETVGELIAAVTKQLGETFHG